MSIISSGKALHSSKFHQKREREKRLRRFVYVGVFVLLLTLVGYVIYSDMFRIRAITVVGESVAREDLVVAIAEEALADRYFWVLPRSNALIYPEEHIVEMLLRKFPLFQSVEVDLQGVKALEITVREREPYALYCLGIHSSECYFLDQDGLIFDRAPVFSDGVYFIYTRSPNIDDPLAKPLLAPDVFQTLNKFIESLEELGIHGEALEIGNEDLTLYLPSGGEVIWSTASNLTLVRTNLELFLRSPAIQSEKNFLERVSYLDLRTTDKVFYQLRD